MTDSQYLRELARTTLRDVGPPIAEHVRRLEAIAKRIDLMDEVDRVQHDAYFLGLISSLTARVEKLESKMDDVLPDLN